MLIHLQIENPQPLAGTAASEGSDPLHFDGWLELLTVISELVEGAEEERRDDDGRTTPPAVLRHRWNNGSLC
jgi:hypothetical protein